MDNTALYSKYRPSTFDEVYGQNAIVQTLRNQIKAQRIAHSYLFFGLKGSGKTSIARIFAKAINCESPQDGNPCNQCNFCNNSGINPDIIEIDAASNNSIDNIRRLVDEVRYRPSISKYKVYIIDEAHMLSSNAFNVLLKTMEEPPDYCVFILCTTDVQKVPGTIKSRCQTYNFKFISINNMNIVLSNILQQEQAEHLNKEEVINYIADKANGSLRDAISMIEQCILMFYYDKDVTMEKLRDMFGDPSKEVLDEMIDCIDTKKIQKGLEILQNQYYNGVAMKQFVTDLYNHYFNQFSYISDQDYSICHRYISILGNLISDIERNKQQTLPLCEVAFIRLCKPEMQRDLDSVIQRVSDLEKRLSGQSYNEDFKKSIDITNVIKLCKVQQSHNISIIT